MKSQWMLSVLAVALMANVGCQSNHAIVRGQNPASCAPGGANGPMAAMPGPIYYDGPAGGNPWSHPSDQYQSGAGYCPENCPDNFHFPKHHHTYDYRQPKNLVYPPQNQPAATVVYPYYTCKGPSDFFMK